MDIQTMTIRELLQWWGAMQRSYDQDYWINLLLAGIDPVELAIVDDVRYRNEALGMLRDAEGVDDPYELAIIDMAMPGMDGLEVCRRLKADPHLAATPDVAAVSTDVTGYDGTNTWSQPVGDLWDPRLDGFAPADCKGHPARIRAWACTNAVVPCACPFMGDQPV